MASEHVAVIDLYSAALAHHEWWAGDYDVHYNDAGYRGLAAVVAKNLTTGR